jgi:hypothetical protein
MRNGKYRTVVAAVLVGAVLFSPLLRGMTCLESRGVGPSPATEVLPPAEELAGEISESEVVGCVLTHVVLNIDVSEWVGAVQGETLVWVGFKAVELVGAIEREWWRR